MKKIIYTALTGAILLNSQALFSKEDMEKCSPMKNGKNIIKANKADCNTDAHNCSGQNPKGEMGAYILVPKGQCEKIDKGDYSGLDKETKDKLDLS